MRLDQLMPEVLDMICCYLNLRDRQALGATCRRMEALAMQPRFTKTIFLRLNKIDHQANQFGRMQHTNHTISKDIVTGSSRIYQKAKITLCPELELDWVRELLELLEARQTPVKHLYVDDNDCLQIMRLYTECQSVFGHIESLNVRQWARMTRNVHGRQLVLPKLRQLFWSESPVFEEALYPGSDTNIALSAPLLEHAFISISTTFDDSVTHTGRYCMPHLYLTKHPELRSLVLYPNDHAVQTLSQTVHPALEKLTLHFSPLVDLDSSYWTGLARCVPNLRTLKLVAKNGMSATDMIVAFFSGIPSIRTLVLDNFVLHNAVFVQRALQSIRHLHIHWGLVLLQEPGVTIELPALETLCVSTSVTSLTHNLKLHLPHVREMSLYCQNMMVDVLSAPRLEQLRLHYTHRPMLSFLKHPLLHLHTLVLETAGISHKLKDLLTENAPALRHITIVCYVGSFLNMLLYQIDKVVPQLETLTIIGMQGLSLMRKSSLIPICRLPMLKALHMEQVTVCGSIRRNVVLPATLTTLTMRNVYVKHQSPFIVQQHQPFVFEITRAAGSRIYNCNKHQASNTCVHVHEWCHFRI